MNKIQNDPNLWVNNKCDKYDYLIAAFCGGIAGLIDVIFVQSPESSKLGELSDKTADKFVERAAQFFYKNDKRTKNKPKKMPEGLEKSISYLEQGFPVPYDARYAKDLKNTQDGVLESMASMNHHVLSLSHSPDPIGLVFSIIDQFYKKGSFIDRGKVISLRPVKLSGATPIYELQGKDFVSKLFCGFVNWIGHIISDISGSSSTRRKGGHGAGVPIPFYELLLMCNIGDPDKQPFADTMIRVYEEGYDARFGLAMSIPVLFEELAIKCIWTIRQKFIRHKEWKESIPTSRHSDLRIMLLVGNGVLCTIDGIDAVVRGIADHNLITALTHVNMIAWCRMAILGVKEVGIRLNIIIANPDDSFLENVLGKIPDDEKERILLFVTETRKYVEALNVRNTLEKSLREYKEAKEERIRIEAECSEMKEKIMQYRQQMFIIVDNYLSEKMETFQEGLLIMDEALARNDSDAYIAGGKVIQKALGYDSHFSSQKEFNDLMESEEDFSL